VLYSAVCCEYKIRYLYIVRTKRCYTVLCAAGPMEIETRLLNSAKQCETVLCAAGPKVCCGTQREAGQDAEAADHATAPEGRWACTGAMGLRARMTRTGPVRGPHRSSPHVLGKCATDGGGATGAASALAGGDRGHFPHEPLHSPRRAPFHVSRPARSALRKRRPSKSVEW
jgi:hypothetical protein